MEQYSVRFSPEAYDDLKVIYFHIAYVQLEPENAKNVINAINDCVERLNIFPLRHPRYYDKELYFVIVKGQSIFYKVDVGNRIVTIVRIISSRRNVNNILIK